MHSQFSKNGKYFAHLSADSKLKVWETSTNTLEQEFIPDFHLTTPCRCMHFVQPETYINQNHSPRKKKRRESLETTAPYIALGTSSGVLLLYSISKANLEYTINSETSQSINSISWNEGSIVFSTIDQNIVSWNLDKKNVRSKWKGGNEKLTSVLVIPGNNQILTASKNIKLWDVNSKEVLQTFVGHSQEVHLLYYVNPRNTDAYIVSGSKGDRLLSVWNLKGDSRDNYVAGFLLEDIPSILSVCTTDGVSSLAVTTRSGVVHFYQHTLNGKCSKPIKPKTTIQVASDKNTNNSLVSPIPIIGAILKEEQTISIVYGNGISLTFENILLNEYEKVQCLIRKDPRVSNEKKDKNNVKVITPIVDNNVHYLTPHTSTSTTKRKVDGKNEVPMEKRLENLMLNKLDNKSKVPKVDNVAQLLVQGLHSKDKVMLKSVLHRRDENIIKNTVKRLPMPIIIPFVQEITALIQGKTLSSQTGSLWLKHLLQTHAGLLLSNAELPELLGPILGTIESRLSLLTPLNRLKGRLDLIVSQVSMANLKTTEENDDEALLIYNDKELTDSENGEMDVAPQSESDNEWLEESSEAEEENDGENDSDDEENDEML